MAGVAGRSGRKVGSRNDTPFRDALRRAVMQADGDEKKLFRIACALVTQAASGDVSAIREVADRLDGKPRQETDVTINDNRDPATLSDAELAAIAASDGSGADVEAPGDSGSVH